MNHWKVPAKTFLIGEYLALQGGPAIILTTTPCFELTLTDFTQPAFHPNSPAGQFCRDHQLENRVVWHDPYAGLGGLGASSAQFVASFHAYCQVQNRPFKMDELLASYWTYAWSKDGQKPSGYDVMAQAMSGCVMLQQTCLQFNATHWPFEELGFILIHTGYKLATHEHLKEIYFTQVQAAALYEIAELAWLAFETCSGEQLIHAVNAYHNALRSLNLVAKTTLSIIDRLSDEIKPLAIKGCGALGSDIVLALVERAKLSESCSILKYNKYTVIATQSELYAYNA